MTNEPYLSHARILLSKTIVKSAQRVGQSLRTHYAIVDEACGGLSSNISPMETFSLKAESLETSLGGNEIGRTFADEIGSGQREVVRGDRNAGTPQ